MRTECNETLAGDSAGAIAGIHEGKAGIGGGPVGIVHQHCAAATETLTSPAQSAQVDLVVSGECSVRTSSCVAGDWFTSDVGGLAVKVTSGFALGRILADPVDGLALCVITPVFLPGSDQDA